MSKCVFVAEMKEFLKDNPTNSLNKEFLRKCCGALRLSSTLTTLRNLRDYCLAYRKGLGLDQAQRSDFKSTACRFAFSGQVKEVPAKELAMHVARKLGKDGILTTAILRELYGELGLPPKQFESLQASKPHSPVAEKVIDEKCYHGNESQISDKMDDKETSQRTLEEFNNTVC